MIRKVTSKDMSIEKEYSKKRQKQDDTKVQMRLLADDVSTVSKKNFDIEIINPKNPERTIQKIDKPSKTIKKTNQVFKRYVTQR